MIVLLENLEQHRDEERLFKSHRLKFKKSFNAGLSMHEYSVVDGRALVIALILLLCHRSKQVI